MKSARFGRFSGLVQVRRAGAAVRAGSKRPAKSRIAWLTTTGSLAIGMCPAPSSASSSPPVSSAIRSPRANG